MSSATSMHDNCPADSNGPLDEDRPFKIKVRTLWLIIGAVAIATSSWGVIKWDLMDAHKDIAAVKSDVVDHGEQLKRIAEDARVVRDSVAEIRYQQALAAQKVDSLNTTINMKLDYLTGDRRGTRPAAGSTP